MKRSTNAVPRRVERVAAAGSARRRRSAGRAGRGRSRRRRPARRRPARRRRVQTPAQHAIDEPRVLAQQAAACRAARGTRRAAPRGRARSSSRQRCAAVARGDAGARCASRQRAAHGASAQAATAAAAAARRRTASAPRSPSGGDEHRVLPLRGQRMVGGDDRPAVGERADAGAAGVDHRLDREDHAGLQLDARCPAGRSAAPAAPRGTARPMPWPQNSRTTEKPWPSAKRWIVCADVAQAARPGAPRGCRATSPRR